MPNDQEVGDSRWSGYVKYEDELAQKACNERWTKSISRQMATFNVRILSILTIQSTTKATIKNRRKGKVEITGKAMKCDDENNNDDDGVDGLGGWPEGMGYVWVRRQADNGNGGCSSGADLLDRTLRRFGCLPDRRAP
jgi:hypothetical protein